MEGTSIVKYKTVNYSMRYLSLKIYGGDFWFLGQHIRCLEVATLPGQL